ncbi:hypothetical protein QJQ45_012631 [Haematococcus lacustris]|nr:hypothetical protein QJQ45_012631 [Haematococcus lacustris]
MSKHTSSVGEGKSDQLVTVKLVQYELISKGQVRQASGLSNARGSTEQRLTPIRPHLQHLEAASSVGTSLEASLKHITVTLATWDAVWEEYLDPKWARQRLRLYGAQDRALEHFLKKEGVVASCILPQPPCSQEATQQTASGPGLSTPPRAKRTQHTVAEQAAENTQPTKGKVKGKSKATKPKAAPQPGRWVDRDCNAALNMQHIGESRWRPRELRSWLGLPELPARGTKGKEHTGLGYKAVARPPTQGPAASASATAASAACSTTLCAPIRALSASIIVCLSCQV